MKLDIAENQGAGLETDERAALIGVANDGERCLGFAQVIALIVGLAFSMNGQLQGLGKGIDDRNTDTMQSSRYLVGVVIEFSACVQDGHDHFGGGSAFFRVDIDWNSTSVIRNHDGIVVFDGDLDIGAMPCQCFVDGIVHHFEHHVMKARTIIGIANIHAGTFADRIKTAQHLDVGRIVACCTHAKEASGKKNIIAFLRACPVPRGTRHFQQEDWLARYRSGSQTAGQVTRRVILKAAANDFHPAQKPGHQPKRSASGRLSGTDESLGPSIRHKSNAFLRLVTFAGTRDAHRCE